jgi:hypothetical protein
LLVLVGLFAGAGERPCRRDKWVGNVRQEEKGVKRKIGGEKRERNDGKKVERKGSGIEGAPALILTQQMLCTMPPVPLKFHFITAARLHVRVVPYTSNKLQLQL